MGLRGWSGRAACRREGVVWSLKDEQSLGGAERASLVGGLFVRGWGWEHLTHLPRNQIPNSATDFYLII